MAMKRTLGMLTYGTLFAVALPAALAWWAWRLDGQVALPAIEAARPGTSRSSGGGAGLGISSSTSGTMSISSCGVHMPRFQMVRLGEGWDIRATTPP